MKVLSGLLLLAWMPLAVAKSEKAYPKEKIAEFVIEKLDVTSMPLAMRPKQEKGKKTFEDYGYVTGESTKRKPWLKTRRAARKLTSAYWKKTNPGFTCASIMGRRNRAAVKSREYSC